MTVNEKNEDASEFPFGACPTCHQVTGRANVGKSSVLFCTPHAVRWNIGFGHFSDCMDETEAQQQAQWKQIGLDSYREVEPSFRKAASA